MKSPIYTPRLTEQTMRYLKGDRIIKAPKKLLQQCGTLTYPFVLLKRDETLESFLICGENSCFTSTEEVQQLDALLSSTL